MALSAAEIAALNTCCSALLTGAVGTKLGILENGASRQVKLPLRQVTAAAGETLATAGTPAGSLGFTGGTYGTAVSVLVTETANNDAKSDSGRFEWAVPTNYKVGTDITITVYAKYTTAGAAPTVKTVDVQAFLTGNAGVKSGSDLCATAAQAVTDTIAGKAFTVTGTGLTAGTAGQSLDILVTAACTMGEAADATITIGGVLITYTAVGI